MHYLVISVGKNLCSKMQCDRESTWQSQVLWRPFFPKPSFFSTLFLAVQNSSIGDLGRPLASWSGTTNNQSLHSTTDPRDLWPFRHLIRMMSRHDLTKNKTKTMTNTDTKTMTNTDTKTMTKTNTFWEHLQRAILETCVLWEIWSGRWGNKTWPKKDTDKDNDKGKDKDSDKDKYI